MTSSSNSLSLLKLGRLAHQEANQHCMLMQRCMALANQRVIWEISSGKPTQMSRLQPNLGPCPGGSPQTHLSKLSRCDSFMVNQPISVYLLLPLLPLLILLLLVFRPVKALKVCFIHTEATHLLFLVSLFTCCNVLFLFSLFTCCYISLLFSFSLSCSVTFSLSCSFKALIRFLT